MNCMRRCSGDVASAPPPPATKQPLLAVPSRDEAAVREALLTHGPLSVGVDASFDFIFYS
jgi:hypothetical protein